MSKIKKYWPLILILILGTLLRFWHNTQISLWHDEAFSALLIKYPWHEMMYRIGLDVHPPLYYILLRFWHYVLGDSLLSLRGFSIFFGSATILAGYGLVKTVVKKENVALVAALLLAINPFQLQYVTEARMYTMGAFFAVLAAYSLVKAFESEVRTVTFVSKKYWMWYLLFALCVSAIMYTHYFLLFTAVALGLYSLGHHIYKYRGDIKKYVPLFCSYILIALLYIPWIKTFLFQYKQVSGGYWIPPMDRWSIPSTIWHMLIGWDVDGSLMTTKIRFILATLFSLFFLCQLIKRKVPYIWLIILNIILPFLGAFAFYVLARLKGQSSSIYEIRYFLYGSIFYTLALAIWITQIQKRWLQIGLMVIYVLANLWTVTHYWKDLAPGNRPGMAAAAKFLNSNVENGQKLYVGSSFEFFNFKYYNQTVAKPLLYSGGITDIHQMPHYAGTAILTNEDLLPDFKAATKSGDTVWLLWTNGFGGSKPTTPENWVQVDEKGYPDVRPYVGTWIIVTEYKVN